MAASCASFGWSQATTPSPAPAAQTPPKPRGPEAVAAQDPNKVVAIIDGQKITAKQAVEMLKPFPPEQRKQLDANLSTAIQQIYTQTKLAESARKLNLDQQSPWKEQLELSRDGVLARAYMTHLSDTAAKSPTEDPQKYYDSHKSEFETVKISGIFVGFNPPGTPAASASATSRTEEQARDKANEVEKKLKAGGDFAALARSESEHQSASKGGELGTYPINDPQVPLPPDVKTAIAKLQPGQTTEPIRLANNTFLIVKLDARETVSYDVAKDGIVKKLGQEVVKKEVEKYTIKVEDPEFFDTGVSPATSRIPSLQRPGAAAQPKP